MNILTSLVRRPVAVAVLGLGGLLLATPASAQTIGTFQFALQPFCNQVSITITQEGATYRLAGWDDACGANERYPLRGVITGNANGTLHFAFTVTRPNGISVETSVRDFVPGGSFSGNFTDSAGNTGTFILGGAPGGSGARPGPTSTVPTNSVTTVNVVDGSINAADVNPAQVQLRVGGTCPAGQAVASVNQDGTVNCATTGVTANSVTTAAIVDGAVAATDVNPAQVQLRVSASCPVGQALGGVNQDGSPVCVLLATGSIAPFTRAVENSPIGGPLSATCQAVATLPLVIPAPGTVTCTAVQHALLNHTNGPDVSRITAEVELTAASCPDNPLAGTYEIPAQLGSYNGQNVSIPVQRHFTVATGPLIVYLNTRLWNVTTGSQFGNALACTYIPQ